MSHQDVALVVSMLTLLFAIFCLWYTIRIYFLVKAKEENRRNR